MKYPKLHGKSLSKEQKATFDKWRETFEWIVDLELNRINSKGENLLNWKTIAWNSAYEVMADKYGK